MKILLTADPEIAVPPRGYGGIQRIVDALVRAYRAQGHTVGLVARTGSTSPADAVTGWPGDSSLSKGDTWRNILALRRAVRAFRPDVLHSFSRLAYLAPLLPTRLPKIMSYQRHPGSRQVKLAARLAGSTLRFTGCSEYISAIGRQAGGTWRSIPNFIELDKLDFVPRVPPDAPLVFLSRVESIKGADLAIAVARAAGRRLIIAGNHAETGPERAYWDRAIAPQIGIGGIEYAGEVDDTRKNALLGRAAALLVPIQWDEPFGIVFTEALAAGTPVITCARGALPEIVTEGRTGFFIQSAAEGAAAVGRIAGLDRAECRREVEARFSVAACAAQYLALYGEMI
jgi:glycosyltransferase involved in cell wall biosynthesis